MDYIVGLVANVTDAFVVLLLTGGMLFAVARALASLSRAKDSNKGQTLHGPLEQLRFDLGQILLLSLEILIISDILHSIVKRTFEEVGILAITVAIRIALSFFLERELSGIKRATDGERD